MSKHRLLGLWVFVVMAFVAGSTWAGTLTIRDSAGFLTPAEVQTLRGRTGEWPFDLHVLAQNTSSMQALEGEAHTWVDGPNVVVVAVDPVHHKVVTRFGTATGVKTGDYDSISAAGSTHFRAHENAQGVAAIVLRARASSEAKTALVGAPEPVIVQGSLSMGAWAGIAILVACFAALALWLYRRSTRQQDEFDRALDGVREESAEYRSRNIEAMTRPEPARAASSVSPTLSTASTRSRAAASPTPAQASSPASSSDMPPFHFAAQSRPVYAQPSATPVYVAPSSSSDLATGLLIGQALSSPRRDREVIIEREVVREEPRYVREEPRYSPPPPPAPSYSPPSYDAGGSSSSYSSGSSSSYDSSSSSSSYDSGGSSSSYDSGGSSDYGGGSSGGDSSW